MATAETGIGLNHGRYGAFMLLFALLAGYGLYSVVDSGVSGIQWIGVIFGGIFIVLIALAGLISLIRAAYNRRESVPLVSRGRGGL